MTSRPILSLRCSRSSCSHRRRRAPELRAGFGSASITPDAPDTWTDLDGDGRFTRKDRWEDRNGNGRFDAVWMAGFQNRRAAAGVHDELEAVAAVFDDGTLRVGIVAADVVGLSRSFVESVRAAHQQKARPRLPARALDPQPPGPRHAGHLGRRATSPAASTTPTWRSCARAWARRSRRRWPGSRRRGSRSPRSPGATGASARRHARPAGDRRRHPRGGAARGGRPGRARHARELRQPRRAALGPQLPAHRRHRRLRAARPRARARLRRRRCSGPGSAAPRSGSPATSAG